ncbi:MAG: hypothetical protein WBG92_23955, partial [Thiohalocapsa sp.]
MPPHDRIAAVISRLNPKTFQACFCSWTRTLAEVSNGEVVALDGKQVEAFFTTAPEADFADVDDDYTEQTDKDHGRLETRRYWVTEELSTLSDTGRWNGLRSIGLVERACWSEDR